MSLCLPYGEINFDKKVTLEATLKTSSDSDIGYVKESDLSQSDNKKEKLELFPFCPEKKISRQDRLSDYMNKIKPNKSLHKN